MAETTNPYGGLFDLIGAGLSVAGGVGLANQLTNAGNDAKSDMGNLAGQLAADSAFKGYGVTTGLGTSTVNPDGSTNVGVGPNQAMQNMAMGMLNGSNNPYQGFAMQAASNSMLPTAGREQDIYNRAMAMQAPALDRAQASQQAREFAMGRGGVRGSQFGGTAEDAAMARARAEASNAASFQAMNQAQSEMMNQGQLANIYGGLGQNQMGIGLNAYNTSFLPLMQQLNALQVGGQNADRSQTGALTGTGYAAQLGLGATQADINAQKAATEIYGNLFDSIMDNFGGYENADGTGSQGIGGMLGDGASWLYDKIFGGNGG